MKVALCLISTGKYSVFVEPLIESVKKYFLPAHSIQIYLFTDNMTKINYGNERVSVTHLQIRSYKFPFATLYRYRIICAESYEADYLYYMDIDSLVVNIIGDEIFGDIVAVAHPGFSGVGGGSWEDNAKSNAYTFPENRNVYVAGGFQGGRCDKIYKAMNQMRRDIADDEEKGIKAIHNDEGHWNRFISESKNYKLLDSGYCMVQQEFLRKAWKIDHLTPRLLALEKNHLEIRS